MLAAPNPHLEQPGAREGIPSSNPGILLGLMKSVFAKKKEKRIDLRGKLW
jgi:hypothetical protein